MKKTKGKKNWFVSILEGILNTIFWLFNAWRRLIETIERTLIGNIAATVPWAAPVPSAYMLFDHAVNILGWDRWVAWVLAIAVEGLGVSIGSTAFDLWNWNDQKKEGRASLNVAFGMVAFYLIVVISVNVFLELGLPVWIAKMGISMLSIPAIVTLALRSQHARRIEKAEADDAQRIRDEAKAAEMLEKERELEFKRQERSKDREFKRQLKLKEAETFEKDANSQKVSMKVSENGSAKPATFGKFRDWRHVPDEDRLKIFQMRNDVRLVMKEYGVIERTGYNWIERAEAEFIGKLEEEAVA